MKLFVRISDARCKYGLIGMAVAFSLLLVVPACGIPKLCKALPGQCMPDTYGLPETFNGMTGWENSAQLGTRDFFQDPHLTGLIEQALYGNQELRILAQEIRIANNEIMKRKGAYFPFLSFGSRAGLEKPSLYRPEGAVDEQLFAPNGHHFPSPLPQFLVAGNVSWQIDIWRQLRNSRDAAALRFLGTTQGRNYAVTRIVAEVAENYYTLIALDKRLENLDRTIVLQEQSLEISKARKAAARGTELAVQRFEAEVRRNQSDKLIIHQEIIETENRINFLCGRYPQQVERVNGDFIDMEIHPLNVGVPAQLLQFRPDIRQAERELAAAGLDVRVARANFYPKLFITAGVGYDAFNTKYLFVTPASLIYNVAGDLVAPLINKAAIRADYLTANAKQLEAIYNYQRVTLNAFTEVVNRVSKVQNYTNSIAIKRQQLASLESAVSVAGNLFQNARVEYIDVLFAQRDLRDARMVIIDTKKEQLSAIVNAYQALGGGWQAGGWEETPAPTEDLAPAPPPPQQAPAAPAKDALPKEDPLPPPPAAKLDEDEVLEPVAQN